MEIKVLRYSDNGESTTSLVFVNNRFFCYGLEDEKREVKIKGDTRIEPGIYEVHLRKELTPMTTKYRKKYSWFKWHLHVQNVFNFKFVYIHVGNDDDDTEGCLLLGDSVNNNTVNNGIVSNSRTAFERFYKRVLNALEKGEKVTIQYLDD